MTIEGLITISPPGEGILISCPLSGIKTRLILIIDIPVFYDFCGVFPGN